MGWVVFIFELRVWGRQANRPKVWLQIGPNRVGWLIPPLACGYSHSTIRSHCAYSATAAASVSASSLHTSTTSHATGGVGKGELWRWLLLFGFVLGTVGFFVRRRRLLKKLFELSELEQAGPSQIAAVVAAAAAASAGSWR